MFLLAAELDHQARHFAAPRTDVEHGLPGQRQLGQLGADVGEDRRAVALAVRVGKADFLVLAQRLVLRQLAVGRVR